MFKQIDILYRFSVPGGRYRGSFAARSMHLLNHKAYVNGAWISGSKGKQFDVINPANGTVVGTVPDMDVDDARAAIQTAHDAFKSWQYETARHRSHLLRRWYDLLVKHHEDLSKILTAESGKSLIESRAEVTYGNSFVDWFSEQARRIHGEMVASPVQNKKIFINKQPIGVAALITPWNFPHAMITRKAGAALAAGCTCVIRPAEDTPLTALAIVQLAHEAGIPKGVINVITSARHNAGPIGKLFCESPSVAGISFTGSTDVGKLLYRQCASGVKRLALELGGNAPFIVFESADLDKAIKGAVASKFRNCGQTCVAANRFLIQRNIFDTFVQRYKRAIESEIVLGDGNKPDVTTGPLINKMQAIKVRDFVADAVAKGANVVLGGKPAKHLGELFYEPTILTNIEENMRVYQEEVFGPVASFISFRDEQEAIEIANATTRGLAGYFYSSDLSQIFRVAHELEVGMVGVNEGMISTAEAAFGGIKESGLGREGSSHGIDEFVYIKYICVGL